MAYSQYGSKKNTSNDLVRQIYPMTSLSVGGVLLRNAMPLSPQAGVTKQQGGGSVRGAPETSGGDCGCESGPIRSRQPNDCAVVPQIAQPCMRFTYANPDARRLPAFWSSAPIATATQEVIDDTSIAQIALDNTQVTVPGTQNPVPFAVVGGRWVANVTSAALASIPVAFIQFSYNRLDPLPQNVVIRVSVGDTALNPNGAIPNSPINEITLSGYADGLGFTGMVINSVQDAINTQRRVFTPFTLNTVGAVLTGYRVEILNVGTNANSLVGSVKNYVSSDITFAPFQRYVNAGALLNNK